MTGCGCLDCSVVELLVAAGRPDLAIRHAYAAGMLSDDQVEAAWRAGSRHATLLALAAHPVVTQ